MAHQLEKNDGLVLADAGAWHGLGTVVKGAPNPFAALRIAGLEWTVERSDTISGIYSAGTAQESRVATDGYRMLRRSDDASMLAVVSDSYAPVQNATLAELAYALADTGSGHSAGVEVETAGSIQGGKKVWMLLRAPSIEIGKRGDITTPFLALVNGHDGTTALRAIPTGTRIVCRNTWNMALGAAANGWTMRHSGDVSAKVEELGAEIGRWFSRVDAGRVRAEELAARDVNRETVQKLWADVLMLTMGPVPANPSTAAEQKRQDRAKLALAYMAETFDQEAAQFGASMWVAANAATNWIQHGRNTRGSETDKGFSAMDGATADLTAKAFALAVAA